MPHVNHQQMVFVLAERIAERLGLGDDDAALRLIVSGLRGGLMLATHAPDAAAETHDALLEHDAERLGVPSAVLWDADAAAIARLLTSST